MLRLAIAMLVLPSPAAAFTTIPSPTLRRCAASRRSSGSSGSPSLEVVLPPPAAHPVTFGLQTMHVLAAASALVAAPGEGFMDGVVASVWSSFESASFVTHLPLFEACLAVSAFVAWIAFFESIHLWLPGAEEWRLDGQPPSKPLDGFGRDLHKTVVPAVTYIGSIYIGQQLGVFTALFGARPTFVEAPSFARFVAEVITGVVTYDLLFYPFHRSFHAAGSLPGWRQQHARHHAWSKEEHAHNAVETVQNSYLDAGVQVFINIFVQNLSPFGFGQKHPLSRAAHNLMVTYLLSEAHSGYDLPFQSHRLFPGIFGGSPRHEEHHQSGSVCFHQFFTVRAAMLRLLRAASVLRC